jgi:hypothetical protein
MPILNHLNAISGDNFWMYASAALALIAVRGKPLAAIAKTLQASVDFLRSEQVAWLLGMGRKLASLVTHEFTQTTKYLRPKAGLKIELNGAIGNSIFCYIFFGLLILHWLAILAAGAINATHLSTGLVVTILAGATGILVPFALYCGGLAVKEQTKAKRLWAQCHAEGLRAYAALAATPAMLVTVAFIVSALQQVGDA